MFQNFGRFCAKLSRSKALCHIQALHIVDKFFADLFYTILLLVLVLTPGIGLVRGGARSWIGLASFNIQPAEIVKVTVIMYLCYLNDHLVYPVSALKKGLLLRLVVILFSFGLVMLQPDLWTGLIIVDGSVCTLFFQGAKIKHFFSLFLIGFAGLVGLILAAPY